MELSNFELCDRSDRFALLQCLVMVVRDRCPLEQYESNPDYQAYVHWRKSQGTFSQAQYDKLVAFLLDLESGLHEVKQVAQTIA